jgi:hypothetical protein
MSVTLSKSLMEAALGMMAELFNESDSEDDLMHAIFLSAQVKSKKVVPKINSYAEVIVPQLDGATFKSHFRMLPSTFELLLSRISGHLLTDSRQIIGPEKQLLICIWTLANQESFR